MGNRDDPDCLSGELRSFGRRRARPLSARQQGLIDEALPRHRLGLARPAPSGATLAHHLLPGAADVWLEIGFGGGEHLIWQASQHPDVVLIGCEPFVDGVVKALAAIAQQSLGNVRLHDDDARDVLRWLPAASIGRAFILFPDPWPKTRHRKRRLVSPAVLKLLARVLRPGAELRIATDIGDYARTAMLAFSRQTAFEWMAATPADWRVQGADWPVTRYQQKAMREGRGCIFLRFRRI